LLVFQAYFYWGILIFKGLTARRIDKSFGFKGLNVISVAAAASRPECVTACQYLMF
jgi:hypothetical protein